MKNRISILLGVVALTLGAFIFFYERHTLSTGETAERVGRALPRFVRSRVERLSLEGGGREPIRFERQRDEDDQELGIWAIVSPGQYDADEEAVDGLLSDLEWLNPQRSFQTVTAEQRERFGLADPSFTIGFSAGNEDVQLEVGAEDPRGGGRFAARALHATSSADDARRGKNGVGNRRTPRHTQRSRGQPWRHHYRGPPRNGNSGRAQRADQRSACRRGQS